MKRTNRLYYVLALILVLVLSFTALFACVDPNDGDDDGDDTTIETRDQLLSNGTFYNATSSTSKERFVKDTVPNWTKTSGAIGYSAATMGAIDVKKLKDNASTIWDTERFKEAAGKIDVSKNTPMEVKDDGNRDYEDTNALIIASTSSEASVYYSSSSTKLEKGKYYVLNIDVWTFIDKKQGEEGEGAYIFVTDGVYSEWVAIDTEGGWETFTLYIEANNFEDRSFGIQLWLGNGPAKIGTVTNERLTQGVALFDNIILKEITDTEYAAIDEDTVNKDEKYEYVKKESAVFPDMEFEYNRAISSSSTAASTTKAYYSARVGAPYNYTQIVGKSDISSDKPPVSSAGNAAPYGIFDLAKLYQRTEADGKVSWTDTFSKVNTTEFLAPAWQDFYAADGTFDNNARATHQNAEYPDLQYQLKDSRALLIFNNVPSGIGYKSEKKLLLEKGKYYRISVYAYVYVALNLPNKIVDDSGKPIALTETQYSANEQAINNYNANKIKAHMKLTGASLQGAEELQRYTQEMNIPQVAATKRTETEGETTKIYMDVKMAGTEDDGSKAKYGEWQELTFYVSGNSLSDRTVNVEYWLGEGTKDDVENLYQGGVIFDTMSMKVSDSEFDSADFEELSPFNFEVGSNDYADLMNESQADNIASIDKNEDADHADRSGYSLKFGDGVNSKDQALKGYVVGANHIKGLADGMQTGELAGIEKDAFAEFAVKDADAGTTKAFNTILYRNLEATASSFTINSTAEIKANNYYRMSMWIKTLGIDEGKGMTINLLQRVSESDYKTPNVLSSFSGVNTKGEWTEYVFYISGNYVDSTDASGAKVDSNLVTVQFVMGSGDSYTPDTHVKGDVMIAALNVQGQITNSEYNSAASADTVKKYAYSAAVSTENTVTGGRFNAVDYDATTKAYTEKNQKLGLTNKDDQLKPYGDNGLLAGVGKPSSTTWSLTTPISNKATSPSSPSLSDTEFKWTGTEDAAYYEVYFGTTLIAKVEPNPIVPDEEPDYAMKFTRPFKDSGTYYVRTVPKDLTKQLISGKNSQSSTKEATGNLPTFAEWKETVPLPTETKDYDYNFGIIDYANLSEENLADILGKNKEGATLTSTGINDINDIRNLYAPGSSIKYDNDPTDIRYYFGAEGMLSNLYNNVLMLSSQYNTRGGYTMYSSTSLSSESYYEISVWVKTLGADTKASFTIDNSTNTFYNTAGTKYIGFNNVNTSGEWVQLKLYAKTGLTSATLKLKLFMGDPYEEDYASGKGLCAGTVFFDDISMKKLDSKEAYEKLIDGKDVYTDILTDEGALAGRFFDNDGNIINGANIYSDMTYYKNVYAYKTLEFSIDSFDVSTDSTVTATGKKPDDYTQTVLGSNPTTSDAANANVAYGVYNIPELNEEKFYYLYQNFFGENDSNPEWWNVANIDQLKTYMQGFGENVLVMANFVANGMYYKSSSKSIKAESYYQISFYAKLKSAENKPAEFRFYHGDDTSKYEAIEIKGYNTEAGAADHGFKKYTMYVSNPTTSAVSSNYFTFNLGTKEDDVTNYMTGMLVIDNVEMFEVTEEQYDKAQADAKYDDWDTDEVKKSTSGVNFTKFETKTTDDTDDDKDDDETGWTAQSWLILSTALIGAIILIAVVVVLIRRFKKKHIKEKAPEVESNVKVEGYVKSKKETKKDADRREFDD